LISKVAYHLNVPERALQIVSEPNAKVAGRLYYEFADGSMLDFTQTNVQEFGFDAPGEIANAQLGISEGGSMYTDARFVLVCEDGGTFLRHTRKKIWENIPVILVCSHGMCGDKNSKMLVYILNKAFKLQVYIESDVDWGGLRHLQYHWSQSWTPCPFEGKVRGVPTILLGLKAQDFDALGVDAEIVGEEMDDEYYGKMAAWLNNQGGRLYEHGNELEKKEHVATMLSLRKKVQIESVPYDKYKAQMDGKLNEILQGLGDYQAEEAAISDNQKKVLLAAGFVFS